MKKHLLLPVLVLSISFSAFGQEKASTWKPADRADFVVECVKTASEGMSIDSAKFYCHCMQDLIEKKYPVAEDAARISAEDLQSEEWQTLIFGCLNIFWEASERNDFLATCIDSAKAMVGEERAKSYCDCSLYRVQRLYPKYPGKSSFTREKMNSPEWQKIIRECSEF